MQEADALKWIYITKYTGHKRPEGQQVRAGWKNGSSTKGNFHNTIKAHMQKHAANDLGKGSMN